MINGVGFGGSGSHNWVGCDFQVAVPVISSHLHHATFGLYIHLHGMAKAQLRRPELTQVTWGWPDVGVHCDAPRYVHVSMHTYIPAYACTYLRTYVRTYIHTHTHACTCTCTCTCACVRACACACGYVCMYVRTYMGCMHVCMYVCMYVCM